MSPDESQKDPWFTLCRELLCIQRGSNEPGPPEDLFMLAIKWRKDYCGAGQENNYRA